MPGTPAIPKLPESRPPPFDDRGANLRWLRDREQVRMLYQRYAYGVDTGDFALVRSVFHPDCRIAGTLEEGALDDYLEGIEEGLQQWHATMHFLGNQYLSIDGDRGSVESWVVGYHMEAPDSPLEHLVLGLRYQDEIVRVQSESEGADDWKIIRRSAVKQWHTGPFPRPSLGPPIYPRR